MRRTLKDCFISDDRGNIAILSAGSVGVLMLAISLTVDHSSLLLERREAQTAVDLAAMAAAGNLGKATTAANHTIASNNIERVSSLTVTKGRYTADVALTPEQRFIANMQPFNAVRVELSKTGKQYFSTLYHRTPIAMHATGIAANDFMAMFSIGSRLASVNGGVPNAVLSAALGGSVSLSVSDYNALLSGKIELMDFMGAMATEIGITAGTYTDVMNSNVTVGQILNAIATVSSANGNATAATAATLLRTQSLANSKTLTLSKLLDAGPYANLGIGENPAGQDATFGAMELIQGAVGIANRNTQLTINLAGSVPGLLSLKLDVMTGEPQAQSAWVRVGEPGATVYTAQTRLRLTLEVGGTGILSGARIKLPVFVTLASARGRLDHIHCDGGDNDNSAAGVGAKPGLGDVYVGEVTNAAFQSFAANPTVSTANMVDTAVIKVSGSAHASLGSTYEDILTFTESDVAAMTVKSTSVVNMAETLVQSLLGSLNLTVTLGPLSLILPSLVKSIVSTALGAVAAPVDAVVFNALSMLGIHVGEADVRMHGILCNNSVLVN